MIDSVEGKKRSNEMQTSAVQTTAPDAEVADIAALALELTKANGAEDAKVEISRTESRSVTVRNGVPAERKFQLVSEVTITVFRDGRRASTATSDLSRSGLDAAIVAALSIAAVTARDEAAGPADEKHLASDIHDLDLCHPADVALDDMVESARRAEAAAYAVDKAIAATNGASVHVAHGVSLLATSRGFMGSTPWSMNAISATAVAAGERERQIGFWSDAARVYESLPSPDEIGKTAASRALGALNSRSVPTQTCPVLFEPMAAMGLLREFVAAASGDALYRTGSFLKDRAGTSLFPEDISVIEDPFVKRGMSSRCFDGDGISVSRRAVIDRGVLRGYFLGLYAARRLKMEPTGSGYGPHNLEVRSERSSTADDLRSMLSKLGRGLFVTDLVGGGVNRLNGDLSRAARGFWVEGGEIQFAVSGVTLASNLFDMFGGLRAIGGDRLARGGMTTGSWLIDEMKVGGL
ncbi:TldD/PmbA family protein [Paraburkholderia caribensis]|uniref:TldD/PmbA family protein n=1 Tax=Paraburkholderia caribensis TaxID=75105 RepID=UPI0031E474E3